jgi:predicted nucleotidyltransferase
MPKLNLTSKEKLALKEFKEKILKKMKGEVLDIKLFGSKARGNFKEDSDIDVLVLLKKLL